MFGIFGSNDEDEEVASQSRRDFMKKAASVTGGMIIPTSEVKPSDISTDEDLEDIDSIEDFPSSDYISAIKSFSDPKYSDGVYPDGLFVMTQSENNIMYEDRIRIPVTQMEELPNNHPLRIISGVIPDLDTTPGILRDSSEDVSQQEVVDAYDRIGEKLERSAEDWDDAFSKLKEDAEFVNSSEMGYMDERKFDGTHYIEVPQIMISL